MAASKQVSAPDNELPVDFELDKLIDFIRQSLTGDNRKRRTITTDQAYSFTVHTVWSKRIVESHVVRIEKGQTLYLFGDDRDDTTSTDQFMVSESECSWLINEQTGTVKYYNRPIHVTDKMFTKVLDLKVKRLGSRRK